MKTFPEHCPRQTVDHTLIRNSVIMLLLIIASYLISYAVNAVLARWLGPAEFGDYSIAKYFIALVAYILLFGRGYAVTRFIPLFLENRQWEHAKLYLKQDLIKLFKSGMIIFVFGIIFAFVLLPTLHNFPNHPFNKLQRAHPLVFTIWIIPLFAFNIYLSKILRSFNRIFSATIVFNILRYFFLIGVALMIFTLFDKLTIYQALYAYGTAQIFTLAIQILLCKKMIPEEVFNAPKLRKKNPLWKKTATHLLIINLEYQLISNIIIFMLEIFGPNEPEVGLFAAILIINNFYYLIFTALVNVITPLISPCCSTKNKHELQRMINSSNALLIPLTLILSAILLFYNKHLMDFFGHYFTTGSRELVTVIIVSAVSTILGMPLQILQLSGNQALLLTPMTIMLLLVAIISPFAIHFYALWGAVYSFSGYLIIFSVWIAIILRRAMGLKTLTFI